YNAVKKTDVYKGHFVGKTIVIVLDNAPAPSHTEGLVKGRKDLEQFRFRPYSSICNPIEGCFSALKAHTKAYFNLNVDQMINLPYSKMTERRMCLLERAADHCMARMDLRLVSKMARHCALSVGCNSRGAMSYGTKSVCLSLNPHRSGLTFGISLLKK
ncbi:hypothetical protein JG688_00005472, partial [Phytophthora aleatoria]